MLFGGFTACGKERVLSRKNSWVCPAFSITSALEAAQLLLVDDSPQRKPCTVLLLIHRLVINH